jgi:hypothetical protein
MNVCFYTVWFRKKKLLTAEQISTSIEALLPVIEQTSRRTLILSIICIQLNGSGNHKPARLSRGPERSARPATLYSTFRRHVDWKIPTSTKETQRIHHPKLWIVLDFLHTLYYASIYQGAYQSLWIKKSKLSIIWDGGSTTILLQLTASVYTCIRSKFNPLIKNI